jgi:nucleoside 2-deoxyribosyltransferase
MKKTLYLAGPIKENPTARESFCAVVSALQGIGYTVRNPFDINPVQYFPGYESMTQEEQELAQLKADLVEMLLCDGVATLPLNHSSKGTARELALAYSLHMQVMPVSNWMKAALLDRHYGGDEYGQG